MGGRCRLLIPNTKQGDRRPDPRVRFVRCCVGGRAAAGVFRKKSLSWLGKASADWPARRPRARPSRSVVVRVSVCLFVSRRCLCLCAPRRESFFWFVICGCGLGLLGLCCVGREGHRHRGGPYGKNRPHPRMPHPHATHSAHGGRLKLNSGV